jgi:uncharacterized membrane protein YccC
MSDSSVELRLRETILELRAALAEANSRRQLVETANPREEIIAAEKEHRVELKVLSSQIEDLEKELRVIKQTRTWRIGRMVLAPVRLLRRLIRPHI